MAVQCPSLSAGHGIYINLGKEGATYNRYSFGFHYVGNNSTSNYFSFSSYSGPSYNFDCAGNATFPTSLAVPTVTASTAITTPALTVSGTTSVPTANTDNNSTTIANTAFVKTAIANLVGTAPTTLDTLQELATALGNDANFSATVTTAIGEKVAKAGDTLTGPLLYDKTPSDDTELPNKAYVDSAIKTAVQAAVTSITTTLSDNMHAMYPVGSYIYSDKADNPSTYLPYMSDTTWVQTAAGRVLIGAGTADSGTVYTAGQTGGEEKHQLTVEELAAHTHRFDFLFYGAQGGSAANFGLLLTGSPSTAYTGFYPNSYSYVGGNQPHNNLQPYSVVLIWRRTA